MTNKSEKQTYSKSFPEHPVIHNLYKSRAFVQFIHLNHFIKQKQKTQMKL